MIGGLTLLGRGKAKAEAHPHMGVDVAKEPNKEEWIVMGDNSPAFLDPKRVSYAVNSYGNVEILGPVKYRYLKVNASVGVVKHGKVGTMVIFENPNSIEHRT